MEIIIRKVDKYLSVIIKDVSIEIDLGLHNENDRKQLAMVLLEAATTLVQGVN